MPRRRTARQPKTVSAIQHTDASRPNIPTAEHQPIMTDDEQRAVPVTYPRNTDLDPQLVWRGKDEQDQSDLVAQAPPLYIQEKVHPKVLIDDLMSSSQWSEASSQETRATGDRPQATDRATGHRQLELFADFNGLPEGADRTAYYQYEGNWSNRMILGDSLQVMASLAEREGLRGKVQCIYLDPPYGIKFNSNFQWSTKNRDVRDGNAAHVTREPEQVKAFRDTWRDGIHSYLSYLRDRLTVARDLLTETGSIFVQIGDENVHRVRAVMDEVFGEENFVETISYRTKNMTLGGRFLEGVCDTVLWYAKGIDSVKYRKLFRETDTQGDSHWNRALTAEGETLELKSQQIKSHALIPEGVRLYQLAALYPTGPFDTGVYTFNFQGKDYNPPVGRSWKSPRKGMRRLDMAGRIEPYRSGDTIRYRLFLDDYPFHLFTISGLIQPRPHSSLTLCRRELGLSSAASS